MTMPTTAPAMRLDVYSHGIKVSGYTAASKGAVTSFCHSLAQMGYVRVGYGKFEYKMVRVYAASTKLRDEFRFHRNLYNDLIAHLTAQGYPPARLEIVEHPPYEPVRVEFVSTDTREPRPVQVPLIDYLTQPTVPGHAPSKVITLQTGQGKAQPLDSLIRVPGGWKTMGDMTVGSEIIAKDGSVTQVTAVYPQGVKEIFRITFADGRSAECCAEHLWRIYYINTVKHKRWRVVNTAEIMRLLAMPNPRVYIDLIDPEERPEVELPIPAYTFGALLGDGHLGATMVAFTTADPFIVEEIEKELPAWMRLVKQSGKYAYRFNRALGSTQINDYLEICQNLRVAGKLSHEKAIPEVYLSGSIAQRFALLQGMMDTDGTIGNDNAGHSISYSTSSHVLAEQVQYLVRSLGGMASISSRIPQYTHRGVKKTGQVAYRVNIRFKQPSLLFRLPRKLAFANDEHQYADLKLRVRSIESVGYKEAQCIAIAHSDKLYVTNDFVVTHNTFIFLTSMGRLGVRTALVIRGGYVEKWVEDAEKSFAFQPGELMVVRGSSHLKALIELALAGELKAKFIIITNKTLQNYFKSYEQFGTVDTGYHIPPEALYETLGVGLRGIDEVHQDFHLNFKQDLYCHVPLTISLSATLESDDAFMNKMYQVAFPTAIRTKQTPHRKYIVMKGLVYSASRPDLIRTKNAMKQYSHVKFEQSVMRNKQMLKAYVRMITELTDVTYVRVREKGQKMLIFFATTQLCTIVRDALREKHPNLAIERYVAEDPYENLLSADISVSTIQSAGTAVDIPGLRIVLMTNALSAKQANEQVLGRLRELKDWPEIKPEFYFLICRHIPKHCMYAQAKQEKLGDKILSYQVLNTPFTI